MIQSTMMDYQLTLTGILKRSGSLFKKIEIVSSMPDKSLQRYTYADLYIRSKKLSAALKSAGLEPGQRVATMMWNSSVHLEAYFGVPCAMGVFHTLNFRLHSSDLTYIANHADDRFAIIDEILLPIFQEIHKNTKIERVFVANRSGKELPSGYECYEDFLETGQKDYEFPELNENSPCAMCYTSGTTGKPKGVVYSHRAVVLHTYGICLSDTCSYSSNDVLMPVVPQFHANAWGTPFAAAMVGAKMVMPGPHMDPVSLLNLANDEQVTVAVGVPTIWIGILQELDKSPTRWKLNSNLRTIVGGSAMPESMIRGFFAHGIDTIHAWGMTEMSPIGTVSHLRPYMDKWNDDKKFNMRAKQGPPAPMVEVRAMNEEGEINWDGTTMGELQVKGPCVASSYYNAESDKWTKDGWFGTGDVVTIDEDGYIKIADRTKDLIKSGGEWISSVDIENALMGHPSISEAAVVAIPHPKWDERPLAAIVLKPGLNVCPSELKKMLLEKFAKWWVPEAYEFIKEIPKTSAGKFKKSALREKYEDWSWED
tara:strand:+ start:10051 stop:11664 length:1614 start_codon:yes stop_codon:yes gene_type:complete